ncbi:helix-turn-helix transcriptional regulator [Streptomyces sp. NRRL WC-3725]|uniref:helix-turn-helix transcriptional regulator n=1 Tax=Streptomyces sp. NRRL WC-3725 TaxID=1463933 RepID=UPI0004CC3EC2|nr:AAA family ATPase [Streptomyces sp. NRRL WC-3725]
MNARTRLSPLTTVEEAQPALSLVAPRRGALPDDPGLVGRDPELRALKDFLREARAHGAARVVCGHAGAGKSALLEATVQAAVATGMRVLRCTGIRGGNPPGLSGLLQIVRPLLADPHRSPAAGPLDAVERVLVDGAPAPGGPSWLPFAVVRVLESVNRAGQPLLVAVDDWDALDAPSRDVLTFVARRAEGHPLALLMTSRPHRTRPASLAGLPELPLGPLGPAESARLLAARRPGLDAQAMRELLATAAGNPLALLELPAGSEDSVPCVPASSDRLAAALAPGAAHLPSGTRDLLLVAALHPAGDLPLLLSAASRIGGAELDFTALDPAERAGLVAFDGMRLHFGHPATAGAVVHGTDPRRCRAAHAALAAVLAPGSVQMLWHRSQAVQGCDPELAGRLEAVHGQALEQCEPPMAVRLLRRAADLHPLPADRGRCALRAAQLAHVLGLERLARTMAHQALRQPLGPLGTLCAEALSGTGNGGQPPADPAAWPAPAGAAEQENALELARITAPAVAGDDARAEALLAFLDGMPDLSDDPRLLHAMATLAPVRRAATVLAGASAVRHLTDVPVRDLELLGEAALLAGDPLRALDLYRQAERRHRFHDRPDQLPGVLLRQGLAHLAMGDRGQSGHAFRRCAELAEAHGQDHHAAAARLLEDLVRGLRTGDAVRRGSAAELEAARRSVRSIDAVLAVGAACALVEAGEFGAAWPALSSLLSDPGSRAAALFALIPYAETAEAENASEEALATLDRIEAELGAECPPAVAVRLTVARAVLADGRNGRDHRGLRDSRDEQNDQVGRDGRDAQALSERAFAEDLALWPCLEAPLRLAQGRRLRRRRQFADSRAALRQAAAGYTMLGAEARLARIAGELRASGERADGGTPGVSRPAAARDLLTPQELRIAELAGRGLSNREVGEQLGLSPRTIGAYLYRIFPRLGVTARAQLTEVLRDRQAA